MGGGFLERGCTIQYDDDGDDDDDDGDDDDDDDGAFVVS